MKMKNYIIRRLILTVPIIFIITLITFLIVHLAPGGPFKVFSLEHPSISNEIINALKHQLGLDKPIHIQYLLWLKMIFTGSFGYSYLTGRSVSKMISVRLFSTLELNILSLIISLVISIYLGVISATKSNSIIDNAIRVFSLFGISMPSFWIGIILIYLLSVNLGLLPVAGTHTIGANFPTWYGSFFDHVRHLILPVTVYTIGSLAGTTRLVRITMLEVLNENYIKTARTKGLSERMVLYKHALRNALNPVVTSIGMRLGYMLSGSAVIESVFGWPGLGRLMVTSAFGRDYPVLMANATITAFFVVFTILLTDIMYAFLDPRIRY